MPLYCHINPNRMLSSCVASRTLSGAVGFLQETPAAPKPYGEQEAQPRVAAEGREGYGEGRGKEKDGDAGG